MGVLAGVLAVAASFILRVLFGVVYLPELAADAFFSIVPGSLESAAVETLGVLAKETTYLVASVLLVLVLGLVPLALKKVGLLPRRALPAVLACAVSTYAILLGLSALFASVAQVSTLPVSPASLALGMLVPGLAFPIAFVAVYLRPLPSAQAPYPMERVKRPYDKKRRLFIASAAAAAVGAAILYYGVGALFSKETPVLAGQETSQILSSQVTPNSDFYRVDINIFAPSVDAGSWKLSLEGLVGTPMTLDYSQITSLPSVEEYATLECVSNVVSGDLMSTALWKGVPLKNLLDIAGVDQQAAYVVFRCYDGYDVGVPLEMATADGAILAYEMNGVPLPTDHGFPLRAIIPGLYGMMNAKWITEIELVSGTYQGFWQRSGWTNAAIYQTGSTIVSPGAAALRDRFPIPSTLGDVYGSPVPIIGTAFAGDRGISKVEVSTDGGTTWEEASLIDPLSMNTWVFWRLDWNPPALGDYQLVVRATDGNGFVQVATMTNPFPNGATGYSVVDVRVSSAPSGGTQ